MRVLILSLTVALIGGTSFAQELDQKAVDGIYERLWDSVTYLQSGEPDPYSTGSNQQFASLMGREDLISVERQFHFQKGVGACGASVGPVLETVHDPLTLSQTACYATGNAPVLAQTRQKNAGETKAYTLTDYMIGHPPLTFTNNRPDWRRTVGDIDTPVPAAFLGHSEPVIIEALRPEDPDLAVPVERLLLLPGETDIPLLLPPGTYRVEALLKTGKVGGAVTIDVAAQPD